MQAYHGRGQPIGPYISQTPYGQPQATYYTQYTPYGPYAPLGPPQPVPFPGGYGPDTYDSRPPPQAGPPRPRQRPPLRQTSQKGPKELKSILKQPRENREASSSTGHGEPLSRSRTNSMRQRANSSTRPQFDAHPPFTPEHLFVALDNTGELRIEGIAFQQLIDELREQVIPMWPHGVIVEDSRDHRWRVQFAGRPWTSSHEDGLFARRLLSQLFLVLNRQGYSYLTTVNTSGTPCRLLFSGGEIPADGPEVYFFNICFSQSGDKISIVDAPPQLVQHLGRSLRSVFPNKIESDTYKEGNVYTIRMKRGLGGSDVDKTLLAAYVLKFWKEMGYELNGSLPLGRRLNLGAKKEVWMFRGAMPRPPSAHSHR